MSRFLGWLRTLVKRLYVIWLLLESSGAAEAANNTPMS